MLSRALSRRYFFFFAAILAGTILFAAVQGIICGVVTTGDPDEIQWRQSNDSLNYMMEDCGMEQPMRIKVRIFFRKAKKMLKRRSYEQLVDNCLSDELQAKPPMISHDIPVSPGISYV